MFRGVDGADRMHAIRIVYSVRIVGGELRDEPDGSTDTCRWFTTEEAREVRLGELARRVDCAGASRARRGRRRPHSMALSVRSAID